MVITIVIGASFAAACALGVVLLCLRVKNYATLFAYNRRWDYKLGLDDAYVQEIIVDLTDKGFVCPPLIGQWDAILLQLNVRVTGLGKFFDPAITFRCGERQVTQYLERGAQGRRYANLSELLPSSAREDLIHVGMSARQVTWDKGQGRLLLMRKVETLGPTMVIAPHPDDAEIAAFGYYSRREAWVVTLTQGERGSPGMGKIEGNDKNSSEVRRRARVWNSLAVPLLGNVPPDRVINLGYPDGELADIYVASMTAIEPRQRPTLVRCLTLAKSVSNAQASLNWNNLVEELCAIMLACRPVTVVAPHPLLDRHYDHKYTALAAAEAVLRSGLTQGNMLLYSVHAPTTRAHPVGRTNGVVSIPPSFDDTPLAQQLYSESLEPDAQALKAIAVDSMLDIRGFPRLSETGLLESVYVAAETIYRCMCVYRTDFLRRSVRPNELFFVIPYDRVREYFAGFSQHILRGHGKWRPAQQLAPQVRPPEDRSIGGVSSKTWGA